MGFLSQQLLLSRLKTFIKNLEKDKIKTCLRSGTIELHDVELEEGPLRELLEDAMPGIVPFGVEIVGSFVDTLQIMVPWTKLQSQAVEIHIGHVHAHCLWHLPGDIASAAYFNKMQAQAAKKAAKKTNGSGGHKVPVKESIFDTILQVGTVVTVASVEINVGRDDNATAMVIRMLDVNVGPDLRGAEKQTGNEQKTRSTIRQAFRSVSRTAKGPATTPYRQARHFSKRKRTVGFWRRVKLKQMILQFGEDQCTLFDVVVVEERNRPSDGRRTCPWNIMNACWVGIDCVEYNGTSAGIGRLIAISDEYMDSEALRQEAPKAVAEAARPLVSIDDFLGGDIDFGDDFSLGINGTGDTRASLRSQASWGSERDSIRCAQEELEKEGIKWEEDDLDDGDSDGGDNDSFDSRCARKSMARTASSDAGMYVGSIMECAVDKVSVCLPGLSISLRSTSASMQTSRPLKDDEADACAILFGKITNSTSSSQSGSASGKSFAVRHNAQPVLEMGEPIKRRNSSLACDQAGASTFAQKLMMESREDRDDTFRPTTRQTVRQTTPRSTSVPSSVRSSVRKSRRDKSASSMHSESSNGNNACFDLKFESTGQKGLPSFEVDASRLRVGIGGCKDLMRLWQEEILIEREAYRDVRPKEEEAESHGDKRVPYHLILRDLVISEESINFDSANRFPTVTEINHIDIRTVGPSPTSMQAAPPKYHPRPSALNPAKIAEDPEQQRFWSRFSTLGGKRH